MNKFSIEIKWGVLFSLATIAWVLLEKVVGLHDQLISKQALYTNLFAIVAIAIYVLAIKNKKDQFFKGQMSWRQGFLSGVILSIVIAILSPIVQYISFEYVTPNYFKNIIQYVVDHKIQTPQQAQIYFSLKSYMLQAIYGSLSMGVITAAIVALFLKTKLKK